MTPAELAAIKARLEMTESHYLDGRTPLDVKDRRALLDEVERLTDLPERWRELGKKMERLETALRFEREDREKAETEVERLRGAIVAWDKALAPSTQAQRAEDVLRGIAGEAK